MEPIVLTHPHIVYIIAVADPSGNIVSSEDHTLRVVADVAWIGNTIRSTTLEAIKSGLPYQNIPDNDYVHKFSSFTEAKEFSESEEIQSILDTTLNKDSEFEEGTFWTYAILGITRATTFELVTDSSVHEQDLATVNNIIASLPEDLTDAQRRLLIDLMNQDLDQI